MARYNGAKIPVDLIRKKTVVKNKKKLKEKEKMKAGNPKFIKKQGQEKEINK